MHTLRGPRTSATTVDRKNSDWHRSMVLTRAKQSLLENKVQEGEVWRVNTTVSTYREVRIQCRADT